MMKKKKKKITSELGKILKEEDSAHWQFTRFELSVSTLDLSLVSGGSFEEFDQRSMEGGYCFNTLENAKRAKQIITKMIGEQVRTEYEVELGEEEKDYWHQSYDSDYDCFWKVGNIKLIKEKEYDYYDLWNAENDNLIKKTKMD